jgi:hypothetical protein
MLGASAPALVIPGRAEREPGTAFRKGANARAVPALAPLARDDDGRWSDCRAARLYGRSPEAQASACSSRSLPQNISPSSAKKVGAPNTPRDRASSVWALSRALFGSL